jgi:3-deoxy-D-manno-octulosonic-acid transferase
MVVYNISILLLGFLMHAAALFHPKAKKWVNGRKNWKPLLPSTQNRKVVWFHCASLGEFEQGRPIIEAWRKKHVNDFILLTFFSPSGYEIRKDFPVVDYCCYLPLDTPSNASYFMQHFQPKAAFFVKYEFWLNMLIHAKKNGANLYSISALFRPKQRFFKWYGGIFRNALRNFTFLFVQNEESLVLMKQIGIQQAGISGDTRYDRVADRVKENKENDLIRNWVGAATTMVIGSSWMEDEDVFLPTLLKNLPERLIIAPHEISNSSVERLITAFNSQVIRYTEAEKAGLIPTSSRILILDCIGVLADAYRYGNFAYVGGAFKSGLHNILEPAAFGLPVIFGPKFEKFPEAAEFIQNGIGFSLSNPEEFEQIYTQLNQSHNQLSAKVKSFMQSKTGACEKIMAYFSD